MSNRGQMILLVASIALFGFGMWTIGRNDARHEADIRIQSIKEASKRKTLTDTRQDYHENPPVEPEPQPMPYCVD